MALQSTHKVNSCSWKISRAAIYKEKAGSSKITGAVCETTESQCWHMPWYRRWCSLRQTEAIRAVKVDIRFWTEPIPKTSSLPPHPICAGKGVHTLKMNWKEKTNLCPVRFHAPQKYNHLQLLEKLMHVETRGRLQLSISSKGLLYLKEGTSMHLREARFF